MYSTGYRLYKKSRLGKKQINILITWINRKCKRCGRFLSKRSSKGVCHKCAIKKHEQTNKEYQYNRYHNDKEFREREKIHALKRYYDNKEKVKKMGINE